MNKRILLFFLASLLPATPLLHAKTNKKTKNTKLIFIPQLLPTDTQAKANTNAVNLSIPPTSLTMDEAVQRALEYRPDIEAYSYAIQEAREAAHAQVAGYYPNISISSVFSQQQGESYLNNSTVLSANQLVYSFAGPLQKYKQAKKTTDLSKLEKEAQTIKIKAETEKAFLEAWRLQEAKKTVVALNKSSKETLKKSEHENNLNLLDKNVWLGCIEEYANDESKILHYRDNVQNAYRRLEFLTGQPLMSLKQPHKPATQLVWHPTKAKKLNPLSSYYDLALQNRPEISQGDKKIDIQKWNIKLAQGARLPSITAQAQAGYQSYDYPGTDRTVQYGYHQFGFTVSWQLFDGMVNQYQERQAEAAKVKEMLFKEQTILNTKQEVQDKYYALSKALTTVRTQKVSYLRAHNEFKLRKQELEIGQIAPTDFQAAETAWENAQYEWLKVNVDATICQRDLYAACGYPPNLC